MKTKQRVTLTHMRKRLAEACTHQFSMLRLYHHKMLSARNAGNAAEANYYRSVVLQNRHAAVHIYDLYLESIGYGRQVHFLKQNERNCRRYEREKGTVTS